MSAGSDRRRTALPPDAGVLGADGMPSARHLRRMRCPRVHGTDRVRQRLVHDVGSGWFGGDGGVVVTADGSGSRGRPRAPVDQASSQDPGLIEDLEHGHVDLRSVPGIVAVSAVSLIGGAAGSGAGARVQRRRPPSGPPGDDRSTTRTRK